MRIVISGAAGVGKTTLASKMKEILDYTIIPDYIDEELNSIGLRSPTQLTDELAIKVRFKTLRRKIEAEEQLSNFISDKGVVDYYAYWLACTSNNATQDQNKEFHNLVIEHSKKYQKIIIPPFGLFPIEDNNIRNSNFYHQLKIHTMILGIYKHLNLEWINYDRSFDTQEFVRNYL